MPSNLSPVFAVSEMDVIYKASQISQTLNRKLANVVPSGIYRGFRLTTNVTALTVTVVADPIKLDHVALIQTATGESITVAKTGGNFAISLSGVAGTTVLIALTVAYAIGPTTTGRPKAYTISEYTLLSESLRSELVVLGQVVVPASGTIPAANITYNYRNLAWESTSLEAARWDQILRNSSFEYTSPTVSRFMSTYWETEVTIGSAAWLKSATSNTGVSAIGLQTTTATSVTGQIYQWLNIPVSPGQILRWQAFVKFVAAISGGTVSLYFEWKNSTGTSGSPTNTTVSIIGSIDSVYRKIESTIVVPATAASLARIGILFNGASWDATYNPAFLLDDFQLWIEGTNKTNFADDRIKSPLSASSLLLEDPTGIFSALGALFKFDPSTPTNEGSIDVSRKDQVSGSLPPTLNFPGRFRNIGAEVLANEAQALLPRHQGPYKASGVEFTLFDENTAASSPGFRRYIDVSGNLVFTINAVWGGSTWTKDLNGNKSVKYVMSVDKLEVSLMNAADNTAWNDSSWSIEPMQFDWTTTGLPGFFRGAMVLGDGIDDTAPNRSTARVRINATDGSDRVGVVESAIPGLASFSPIHVYWFGSDGGMEIVHNAYWDGSAVTPVWTREQAGAATKVLISNGVFQYFRRSPSGSTWDDTVSGTGWDVTGGFKFSGSSRKFDVPNGILAFSNSANSATTDTNPTHPTGAIKDELRAKNLTKAWGFISYASGGGGPTIVDAFNVTSATINGSTPNGTHLITLSQAMANTNYMVLISDMSASTTGVIYGGVKDSSKSTTQFEVFLSTSAANIDLTNSPGAGKYGFIVLGVQ